MSKAEQYRKEAGAAEERAEKSPSGRLGARERKRAETLYALADNMEWLEDERAVTVAAGLTQRLNPAKSL
jgi:hypothetical protein